MDYNRIFFLVNPQAGGEKHVEKYIADLFKVSGWKSTVHTLEEDENPTELIRQEMDSYCLFAVYGGDGSITKAAAALIGTSKPLGIIPGGTANVLSKELGIPQDTQEALKMICERKFSLKTIDTGMVNGRPFLLRVNLGIMAEMITEADEELKDKIGQLAYGISAVKTALVTVPVKYNLIIDDKPFTAKGVSLTVTNSGNMGIGGLQLYPGISMTDGMLDVLLLKDAGFLSIVKAAGSSLLDQETDTIRHWTCRKISIKMAKPQTYLRDDCEDQGQSLNIEVVPASLTLIVPNNAG